MKIGIITEYYYPTLGGVTEHVHHFSIQAKKMGHQSVIITGNAGEAPFTNEEDLEIIRLGRSMPIISNGSIARVTLGFNLGRKLKDIFKSEQFDIIHIHSPFVPTLPALAHVHSNTTTFSTSHTQFDSNIYLKTFRGLFQLAMDALDGRIAVSKYSVESVHHYVTGYMRIIPNGIDTDKFNGQHEKVAIFDDDKVNVFFLSRLEPRNGLEYLIKAFCKVRAKRNDCRLIIGGDGPLSAYFKSLVPHSIKHDIHFIGRVDGVRPNYYSTADIFCFPTTKASFSVTILEAMSSTKPVLAFSVPANEGIIDHDKNGILCGQPGIDNLADGLNQLIDSRDKREELGRKARERVQEYSWEKITRQVFDYYKEVKNEQ